MLASPLNEFRFGTLSELKLYIFVWELWRVICVDEAGTRHSRKLEYVVVDAGVFIASRREEALKLSCSCDEAPSVALSFSEVVGGKKSKVLSVVLCMGAIAGI